MCLVLIGFRRSSSQPAKESRLPRDEILKFFFLAPLEKLFDQGGISREPYVWVTFDHRGIIVYSAPTPFIDEFIRFGRLIISPVKEYSFSVLFISDKSIAIFIENFFRNIFKKFL